jgi:MoaA/NifB/PqqE/SkfB family radical SAM enzyme
MGWVTGQARRVGQQLLHQVQRLQFFLVLLLKRRVTLRKLANLMDNQRAWRKLAEEAGNAPTVVLFDISNRCNLSCPTCRTSQSKVVDLSGQTLTPVPLGDMSLAGYEAIIDNLQQDLLLATLYVSGEPLLNRSVVEMVAHADRRGVGTMLSTNGMLLTGELAEQLLNAGLDYLKIAVSGFSQDIYRIYHRGGDIERVLANVALFELVRRRLGSRCMVVLDYILFEHNRHQAADVRRFCRKNGLKFSLRYGRVLADASLQSPVESREHYLPKEKPCDWLWKIMVFCHDGSAVPCCQFATCATSPLVMGNIGGETAGAIWNGDCYRELRRTQAANGRRGLPLCESCFYAGVDFQS